MLGTIVNTCTIIIGSIVGTVLHRGIKEKYKRVLYDGLGLASLAIGLNATITHLPKSQYPVLFIISMALGGIIGTRLDINGRFHRLVDRKGKNGLADGLSTAILLYCIGPLSMLGPVISALKGDNTFLFTNATLDLVSSTVFASTYGSFNRCDVRDLAAGTIAAVDKGRVGECYILANKTVTLKDMCEMLHAECNA